MHLSGIKGINFSNLENKCICLILKVLILANFVIKTKVNNA